MSFINLQTDILFCISSFLDNKNNSQLILTCKTINTHGKENGYLTTIKINYKMNIFEFISIFSQHSYTIRKVIFNGFVDPQIWVPSFKEKMIFEHCTISKYLNPGETGKETKYLKLTDYHRFKNKTTLLVNWKDFPNLEYLELYVYDVDFKNINNCKKLKKIKINTLKYKLNNISDFYIFIKNIN